MKRLPNKKESLIGSAIALFLFAICFGIFSYIKSNSSPSSHQEVVNEVEAQETEEIDKDVFSVLFIGYGGLGHPGGTLSDTQIVARIDRVNKKIALISVPRDLWVEIPVGSKPVQNKINFAHAIGADDKNNPQKNEKYKGEHGAGNLAKDVISNVVGFDIDYYISVDFGQFETIINNLGGIEVDVPVAFEDHWYPAKGKELETCGMTPEEVGEVSRKYSGFELQKQFPCRYELLKFDKGTTKMDGATALKFARSRHSGQHGGDFSRSQRQFALLVGIKNKLISLEALTKTKDLYGKLQRFHKTNIDLSTALSLAKVFVDQDKYEVTDIQLTDQNVLNASTSSGGAFILIPRAGMNDFSVVQEFIKERL